MKTLARSTVLLLTAGTLYASAQGTEDPPSASWPDYRGPNWDGHAPNANVPLKWSEKKNVRWKTRLHGTGWSSPVVLGGKIWMTSATRRGSKMSVVAVDFATGKKLHERTLIETKRPEKKNAFNSYASPSPVIEKGRVYVHFGTYGTMCLDTDSAETLWERRDIHCDHMEGPGSSPVLYEDLLLFNMDGGDVQFVIALDKKTGKTRWRRNRSMDYSRLIPDFRKAYSTPVLVEIDGKEQLISSGARATMGYDPHTGKELWRVRHKGFSMSARPLVGDGMLFLNTGFMRAELVAVRLSGKGDVTADNVVWTWRRNVPTIPSKLLVDGRIYMVNDSGIATCLDAKTGKRIWLKRIGGQHCASPVYAGGRIYFFDRDGQTVVIDPGKEFKQLAINRLGDGFMSSAAVVGNAFILRTKLNLYRIEEEPDRKRSGERRR